MNMREFEHKYWGSFKNDVTSNSRILKPPSPPIPSSSVTFRPTINPRVLEPKSEPETDTEAEPEAPEPPTPGLEVTSFSNEPDHRRPNPNLINQNSTLFEMQIFSKSLI